jgi:hypothetical protein
MNRWLLAAPAATLLALAGLLPPGGVTRAAPQGGLASASALNTVSNVMKGADRLRIARLQRSTGLALSAATHANLSPAALGRSLRATQFNMGSTARLPATFPSAGEGGTRRIPQARAATSAVDLALPANVVDQSYASQYAVSAGGGPFRVFHASWAGFESGVAASFDFQPIATVYYQGSVFDTASESASFASQSFQHLADNNPSPPTDCSDTTGVPCEIVGYETTDQQIAVYSVAQVNACVIETGFQGDPTLVNENSDELSRATADTFLLGINDAKAACPAFSAPPVATATNTPRPLPTNTPVPPVHRPTATPTPAPTNTPIPQTIFAITAVQAQHAAPASSTLGAAISHVKRNKTIAIAAEFNVTSAPAGSPVTVTFTLKRGTATVSTKTVDSALRSPNPRGSYVAQVNATMNKTGTYVLGASVSLNSIVQSSASSFVVKK